MKIGIRKPSIKKSIKARTTGKLKRNIKSSINPLYGKKGMGMINNPKKAIYNKVYNKTTIGVNDIIKNTTNSKRSTKPKITTFNDNKIYKIIDKNKVIINNVEYSIKSIKIFKNTFLFISIFIIFAGFLCLPIGIVFIIFGLLIYSVFKTYKNIYNEMINFDIQN